MGEEDNKAVHGRQFGTGTEEYSGGGSFGKLFIFHLSSFILAFSAEMIQSEKSYNLPCPVSLISRGLCQLCLVGFSAKLLQVQLGFEYMIFFFFFFSQSESVLKEKI